MQCSADGVAWRESIEHFPLMCEIGVIEDDNANNGIQVNCINPLTGVATGSIRSLHGDWGTWGGHYTCLTAFASGFTLRPESSHGHRDDTAANNLRMHYTGGKTLDGLAFRY